jgi:solute carrier family 25 folate transporter 32
MSSTSKTAAMLATYPYQVVRSRLQVRIDTKFSYSGVLDVIRRTARNEGLWAFYRGIVPSTLRVLPGTCITFLTYERVVGWLKANKKK